MTSLEKLLEIACPPTQLPVLEQYLAPCCTVEGGFIWNSKGEMIGSHLQLDNFQEGGCHPLWVYNRTQRFQYLLTPAGISRADHETVLRTFESLESAWKATKPDYAPRKYFLSQRVCLQLICSKLNIKKKVTSKPPIRDKKRLRDQTVIFNTLWSMIQPQSISRVTPQTKSSGQLNALTVRVSSMY